MQPTQKSPVRAIGRRESPWAAVAFQRLEGGLNLLREARLHQHQVATQLIDDIELVDRHRALDDAGAATGAGPEFVFGDEVVEQAIAEEFLRGFIGLGECCAGRLGLGHRHEQRSGFGQPRTGLDDDHAW
jgi:hypothetical protein